MKLSLWDLKLYLFRYNFDIAVDYEAIPMGFETQEGRDEQSRNTIMKLSLWDLKLRGVAGEQRQI